MNKPKQIGTAGETAVVKYCKANGFPNTERIALKGFYDEGDILLSPHKFKIIIEVKSGKAAEAASDGQIDKWLDETERERINARAALGVLVTKRKGIGAANAGKWWVHWRVTVANSEREYYCRMFLEDWIALHSEHI